MATVIHIINKLENNVDSSALTLRGYISFDIQTFTTIKYNSTLYLDSIV